MGNPLKTSANFYQRFGPQPKPWHHQMQSSGNMGLMTYWSSGAQRVSPLVAFMIATCLSDQDIYIRRRVVYILADLINKESALIQTPENIRKTVTTYLHNMRQETIYGILEVAVIDLLAEKSIYHLLNACPYAGKYLGDILTEWKNPLALSAEGDSLCGNGRLYGIAARLGAVVRPDGSHVKMVSIRCLLFRPRLSLMKI